jgi:hypothetical protein
MKSPKLNSLILFILILNFGCKKDDIVDPKQLELKGVIELVNEVGTPDINKSNIKVTLLENNKVVNTDSSGEFVITNISKSPYYNLRCEFNDCPVTYVRNMRFENETGIITAYNSNPASGNKIVVSPIAKINVEIDSLTLAFDSTRYTIYCTGYSTMSVYNNYILIEVSDSYGSIIKSDNQLNIENYWFTQWTPSDGTTKTHSTVFVFVNDLKNRGFNNGDSLYFKIYPITSFFNYQDSVTSKAIFPSRNKGSNIVKSKL